MQLITLSDVAARVNFSEITIANWAYRRRPGPTGFPAPVKIGRQLRYLQAEVDQWIAARAAARHGQPPAAEVVAIDTSRRRGRPRKTNRVEQAPGGEK